MEGQVRADRYTRTPPRRKLKAPFVRRRPSSAPLDQSIASPTSTARTVAHRRRRHRATTRPRFRITSKRSVCASRPSSVPTTRSLIAYSNGFDTVVCNENTIPPTVTVLNYSLKLFIIYFFFFYRLSFRSCNFLFAVA